jgi:hypothetical protein
LTTAERVQAVVDYGFTERQARFLVLVMRHSGLCVKRQYAAFAGIVNGGERCNAFFAKLVPARIRYRDRLHPQPRAPLPRPFKSAVSRDRGTGQPLSSNGSLRRAVAAFQQVVHEEFERLHADTIRELQHYFFHRRRGTDLTAIPETLRGMLTRYAEVYGGPRFTHLYRRWLSDEEAALTPVSPAIQASLTAGRAAVESVILPHAYDHLSPLVDRQLSRRRRNTADAEEGDVAPHGINPSLNPVP